MPRRAEIKKSRAAGIWSWVPKFVLMFMVIFGFLVWVVWAYVRQMQLFLIPETDFWYRLGTYMRESWYLPLVFWAVGVVSFILLEKRKQ